MEDQSIEGLTNRRGMAC